MTPTKLLIGQILIVFAIVIAGLWVSTQWVASMLAYQPELGSAWFRLGNTPVYRPWAIFAWWYHYDAYAPHVFDKAGVRDDAQTLKALVDKSQAAEGGLQAQQASNQLLALATKQQFQIQNLKAAQFRTQSLEAARRDQSAREARERTTRFLGDGKAYTPRQ